MSAPYPAGMKWPRGLVALLATAVVILLAVVLASVVRVGDASTELAGSSAASERTTAPSATGAAPLPSSPTAAPSLSFVLSSFNVLGSSHTAPGGTRASEPPGPTRIRWAASLLARHGVDVVGFQEFQQDQQRTFLRVTRGRYDVYPGFARGGKGSQNSIAWRTDGWDLVDAGTIAIPYFDGNRWPMPVVLLENRETGLRAYFSNFHNPASTRTQGNQARWRRLALAREIALVNRLTRQSDYPVFLTGDLNQRESAFCSITGRTNLVAANGGSNSGECRPPDQVGIDWIFGSADVTFTNYRADRSALVRRTTDHPMVLSRVLIEGAPAQR